MYVLPTKDIANPPEGAGTPYQAKRFAVSHCVWSSGSSASLGPFAPFSGWLLSLRGCCLFLPAITARRDHSILNRTLLRRPVLMVPGATRVPLSFNISRAPCPASLVPPESSRIQARILGLSWRCGEGGMLKVLEPDRWPCLVTYMNDDLPLTRTPSVQAAAVWNHFRLESPWRCTSARGGSWTLGSHHQLLASSFGRGPSDVKTTTNPAALEKSRTTGTAPSPNRAEGRTTCRSNK